MKNTKHKKIIACLHLHWKKEGLSFTGKEHEGKTIDRELLSEIEKSQWSLFLNK